MRVKTYLLNKQTKENTLYRIKDGHGMYVYEGNEMTETEMDQKFPTPLVLYHSKSNPDKTKMWLQDEKSY